jgi:hypothetical protein
MPTPNASGFGVDEAGLVGRFYFSFSVVKLVRQGFAC